MLKVTVVEQKQLAELAAWRPAWEELAREAAEPNLFFEPLLLLPALRHLEEARGVRVVLVHDESRALHGVFPIRLEPKYRGLPIRHYALWHHPHCYLTTPLVRRDRVRPVLERMFAWLSKESRGPASRGLMVWNWCAGDGPVAEALRALSGERRWTLGADSWERPVLAYDAALSGEQRMEACISGRHRRDFARLEKRLSEMGSFEHSLLGRDEPVEPWIEEFLALEASGWKGQQGTALASKPGDRAFFAEACREAFAQGRLNLVHSRLNGKCIATICDFVSHQGTGFAFKIAYDEAYAKYRPGILVHLHQIRNLEKFSAERIDSCALPGSLFDRIWPGRRVITNFAIGLRALPDGVAIRLVPQLKRLRDRIRARKAGAAKPAPAADAAAGKASAASPAGQPAAGGDESPA